MRHSTVALIAACVLSFSGSAFAGEIIMGKHTAEDIKSVCEKAGGSFSQDAQGYGCGTNCKGGPGTDCIVACKNGQPCGAQVIGGRRPTSLLNALLTSSRNPR